MLAWAALALVFVAPAPQAAAPADAAPAPAALVLDPSVPARVAAALRAAPAGGARASAATRPLLGAPYLASPLGEGRGPDPDPRFRLDAFDCMTFVETAVALGSAATLEEAARALDDVRYAGAPALAERNHEVLSQWIPSNVARGWIADVGASVAGARARRETKAYSPESWAAVRAAGRAIPGLPRSRLPLGVFGLDVVAVGDVAAAAERVPEGAIAFAVRVDQPERATRITHAGLVVRGPRGDVRVRHATSSKGIVRVIEEPIAGFLRREGRAYPRWPLAGLAFFEIRANRERVRALLRPGARPAARTIGGEPVGAPPRSPL